MSYCAALPRLSVVRACGAGVALSMSMLGAAGAADAPGAAPVAAPQKVLRYAIRAAETGFDPAQLSDLYSRILVANMLDAPYAYEFLARPVPQL